MSNLQAKDDGENPSTEKEPLVVNQTTFFNHLDGEQSIDNVTLYADYGKIEFSYVHDGNNYLVTRGHSINEDPMLIKVLESKNVEYIVMGNKYEGPEEYWGSENYEYMGIVFVAVPVLMLIAIVVQALIIRKLTNRKELQQKQDS